jgi:hypothetical protein
MENLKFDSNGLIATVVQDATTKDVLMVAWMNAESLQKTIKSGEPGSGAVRGRDYGTRARHLETHRKWPKSATTAMAIRCWCWSSLPGQLAIRGKYNLFLSHTIPLSLEGSPLSGIIRAGVRVRSTTSK